MDCDWLLVCGSLLGAAVEVFLELPVLIHSEDFRAFSTSVVRVIGGVSVAGSAVGCCWIPTVLPESNTEEDDVGMSEVELSPALLLFFDTVVAVTIPLGNVGANKTRMKYKVKLSST